MFIFSLLHNALFFSEVNKNMMPPPTTTLTSEREKEKGRERETETERPTAKEMRQQRQGFIIVCLWPGPRTWLIASAPTIVFHQSGE